MTSPRTTMMPGQFAQINTRIPNLTVRSDQNGNISFFNCVTVRWQAVQDSASHDEIVAALPAHMRSTVYTVCPTPPDALTRPLDAAQIASLACNREAARAAGLDKIESDRERAAPDSPGRHLAQWLIDNKLTYGLGSCRLGMRIVELRHAVLQGVVKSNHDARTLAKHELTGFAVNPLLRS